SPTNGTSAASPGIGSGANLTTGLTFFLLVHSGGTLLQAPQSPSNSPRSIASLCPPLPASAVTLCMAIPNMFVSNAALMNQEVPGAGAPMLNRLYVLKSSQVLMPLAAQA